LRAQLETTLRDARAHQSVTIQDIVEALKLPHDPRRAPLIQTFVSLHGEEAGTASAVETVQAQFDLLLELYARGEVIEGKLTYDSGLFVPATIERLIGHLRAIASGMCSDPLRPVAKLRLFPKAENVAPGALSERDYLLTTWNRTQRDYPLERTLHSLIEAQVDKSPRQIAVVSERTTLTYEELDARANQLAHRLRELGAQPGTLVGIAVERSVELVVGLLGILKAGSAYVPMDPSYPKDRLTFMLEDAQVPILLTQERLLDVLPKHSGHTIVLDAEQSQLGRYSDARPRVSMASSDPAYVIFTSGSTGRPKGAVNAHRGILNRLLWMQDQYRLGTDDTVLQKTPFSFDVSVWEFFWPLLTGARLVMALPEGHMDPAYLVRTIIAHQVTTIHFVPAMLQLFLEVDATSHCTSLRRVICSGEALSADLRDQFFQRLGCELHNLYGPTECAVDVTYWECRRDNSERTVPIGYPVANTQIYILDQQLEPMPIGVAGELHIGGVQVGMGYLGRPELTAEKFVPDPFASQNDARLYRTGDLARYRADGAIEYLGRIDQQVKLRGFRIELGEIESLLAAETAVREVVVTVCQVRPEYPELVAYVVPRSEQTGLDAYLRKRLSDSLPSYMVPSAFVFLQQLPLTPSGKVDRRALPAPIRGQRRNTKMSVAPRDEPETSTRDSRNARTKPPPPDLEGNKTPLQSLDSTACDPRGSMPELKIVHTYDLTPLQQGMLFHALSGKVAGVDILQIEGCLDEELDIARFSAAWRRVVLRHDALRTSFRLEPSGELVQEVYSDVDLPVSCHDWSAFRADEQDARWRALVDDDRSKGFDIFHPPLLRVAVAKLGESHYRLLWSIHHAIIDGRVFAVVLEDVFAFHDGWKGGQEPDRPTPRQFVDYTRWLRELDASAPEAFWKKMLRGFSAPTPLGIARPVAQTLAVGLGCQEMCLSPELTEQLQVLARSCGVSLGNVLQGAWAILLHRYSREQDIVFGVTRTLRMCGLEGAADIVGPLINTLPVRVIVESEQSLVSLLQDVRRVQREIRPHEHTSLLKVHECSEVPRGSSLFNTIVVFDTGSLDSMLKQRTGNWQKRSFSWTGQTNFDVTLIGWGESEFRIRLEYYRHALDDDAAARLMGHLRALLEAMPAKASDPVRELSIVSSSEKRRLLATGNRTQRDYSLERTLHSLIEEQVDRNPQRTAVVAEQASLTYLQVDGRANQLAHRLRELGVQPGILVGIAVERSVELVVGLLGILKAGGAYVPLDPSYPRERLAFMLDDARVPILLTQKRLRNRLPEHSGHTIALDAEDAELDRHSTARPMVPMASTDPAYVIFTSGSTGRPKGAMNAHRGIVNRLLWMQDQYRLGTDDTVLQKTPFSFDVSVWEFFWPLLTGARLVMAVPEGHMDAAYLVRTIIAQQVTTIHFVPAMLQLFLEVDAVSHCTSLRRVICSGEALSADLRDRFFQRLGCELHNLYGPTECAVDVTYWECRRDNSERTVPIGYPVANTQIYILDQQLEPMPIGLAGELHIGGVQVGMGYLDRPELTAEKFIPDPFALQERARLYKTGDLARYRSDGAVEYLGRLDHQVKIRGLRIELGEIESVLSVAPNVAQAVVTVREDQPGNTQLVAYLIAKEGNFDERELRQHLKHLLPAYMVPNFFVNLECFPTTPNGKLDRKALPAPTSEDMRHTTAIVAPRNEFESQTWDIWAAVLRTSAFGIDDNFFDAGGNSILAIQVATKLRGLGYEVETLMVFQHPTIRSFAEYLKGGCLPDVSPDRSADVGASRKTSAAAAKRAGNMVAVIGMSGRFPGAHNLDAFWNNIRQGIESVSRFTDAQLEPSWIETPGIRDLPNYVPARAVLEGADLFDAAFFGFNPLEAAVLDPQHRLLLEETWAALENAGYDPRSNCGCIGIWAGKGNSTYYLENVLTRRDILDQLGPFHATLVNEKDFLATRVSYKLNLTGPSVNVYTGCSTSLVAVVEAYHALIANRCEIAVAGGVALACPQRQGYLYQQGAIGSPDGHCRPFDAKAAGTVFGDGIGVVVLKRLEDAQRDGDFIYALIRGAALNNDGSGKVSYTAPSVEGQADVIQMAMAAADVHAESISLLEAHGTATPLGDPIEVAALTRAFGPKVAKKQFCCLGSVKSNIGHLDAAAGIAGFIKTVLALHHRVQPGTVHFEQPNPALNLQNSPFYVNVTSQPWETGPTPRRAGVSSFGIGGTNAHVVLEEAPTLSSEPILTTEQLLVLSARSPTALAAATKRLRDHLQLGHDIELPNLAHTLQVGRHAFEYRRALVCASIEEAVTALGSDDSTLAVTARAPGAGAKVAFLFPGQGSQYVDMGAELLAKEPTFAAEFAACADVLTPILGVDIRTLVFPEAQHREGAEKRLQETAITQPVLFAIEYALARLWLSWGIHPSAMIGHSLGEYVAACLAGAFSRDEALKVVSARGRLMQAQPPGAMLTVRMPLSELERLLESELVIAGYNAPMLNVVSGAESAVNSLRDRLTGMGINCRVLATSHAFHSPMMDGALQPFRAVLAAAAIQRPTQTWLSCVTGDWVTPEQVTNPEYWVQQLREPVRFSDGIQKLLQSKWVLLEVGPGQALSTLARLHTGRPTDQVLVSSLGREAGGDRRAMLKALGGLWVAGATPSWPAIHAGEQRTRMPLPTYPFERKRFWIEPAIMGTGVATASGSFGAGSIESQSQAEDASWLDTPFKEVESDVSKSVRRILSDCSGIPAGEIDATRTLIELGFDSLLLGQVSAAIQKVFAVRITFRQLMDEHSTLDRLVRHLELTQAKRELVMPGSAACAASDVAQPFSEGTAQHGAAVGNPVALALPAASAQDDSAPMSDAQQELWTAIEMGPEASCAYNLCFSLTLSGKISIDGLRRAAQQVLDRHEALRTKFDPSTGVQHFLPPGNADVSVLDLSALSERERFDQIQVILDGEVQKPGADSRARANSRSDRSDCASYCL
jgi:amino acid adenylation domain-containing protein